MKICGLLNLRHRLKNTQERRRLSKDNSSDVTRLVDHIHLIDLKGTLVCDCAQKAMVVYNVT